MRPLTATIATVVAVAAFGGLVAARAGTPPMTDDQASQLLRTIANDQMDDRWNTAGYMDEATFDRHAGSKIDRLCGWVDSKLEAPGALEGKHQAYTTLHNVQGAGGDGLPLVLLAVCGYHGNADQIAASFEQQKASNVEQAPPEDREKIAAKFDAISLDWFYQPPYLWGDVEEAPVTFSPWQG